MDNFLILAKNAKNISELARQVFGSNSTKFREDCKRLLQLHGIQYDDWKQQKKDEQQRYCLQCGKKLTKNQKKFCCASCSATYNNHKRYNINETFLLKNENCISCGKKLKKGQKKFCGRTCQYQYEYIEYIEKWKNGEINGVTGKEGYSTHIKKYLLEKHDNKCELCGWGEMNKYTQKIPLQIHHIDGDCTNNKEENLQLLCPNCHSLTDNYGNSGHHKSKRVDKRFKRKLNKG